MHTKPKYQGKLITTLSQPKRGFAKKSLQHTKLNVIPTSERAQKSKQLTLDEIKPQKRQESTRAESVPSIIPLLKTRINVLHDDDSDFLDELTSEKTQVQDDTL
ncbi:hypothetical protein BLNAU_21453 [Blattamonas nauphoetae]|uniref:Uncharacterized protein n=1 Tax=Blattamonas nauphoetae TaxID=2049346 RepID=A0ABQ9WVV1_9EUKA|nr:hypothetical protein BLNAU_21453 [Blattamonas nauphoetae]